MPFSHRFHRRFLAAALAALLGAGATTAHAQDPNMAAAQELTDAGNRAAAAGDFTTALERFNAAYARYQSPAVLLNIGLSLRRLGRHAEAGNIFDRYLREPGSNPQRVDDVRRQLGEIDATVGRLTISLADPSARIWLDGRELPGFPNGGTLRVDPGDHTVAAGRAGPELSEVVRVEPRATCTVLLGSAAPAPAPVMVPAPPPDPALVEVPDAEPPRRRSMSGQRIAGVVLDTVGGLGIATGIGLGIAALSVQQASNRHCLGGGDACEPRAFELERQARGLGQAASICLGAGAGVLVTGLIVGATARRYDTGSTGKRPRVGLGFAPGGGSITVEGSW